MNSFKKLIVIGGVGLLMLTIRIFCGASNLQKQLEQPDILSYEVVPEAIQFYYQNEDGLRYQNAKKLKVELSKKGKELLFAMNGGMYEKGGSPKGLYIEKGKEIRALDQTEKGYGNFYLQPNGVFYLDYKSKGYVSTTKDFKKSSGILYATQSGPMLLIDGAIHPQFKANSRHLNVRNGVGILPNGNLLFALSTKAVNFYTFAKFFQNHGCKNALYLDGFVSRMYLPSQNRMQEDGDFGVLIGEVK